MALNDMKKICVLLYEGRCLGKEMQIKAEEIFCDCTDKCSLYKQGKCLKCRTFLNDGDSCSHGKIIRTKGYTSCSEKHSEFYNKYMNDELYTALSYPENLYFGVIGNMYWLNLKYIHARKARSGDEDYFIQYGYLISSISSCCRPKDQFLHILFEEIDIDFLNEILSYRPLTIDFKEEIKDYQATVVPNIVTSMKMTAPELYSALTEKYPEYMSDKYTPI